MSEHDLTIDRRSFLAGSAGLLAAAGLPAVASAASRARINVVLEDSRQVIPPDNYGYLLEVIGSSIYDGVWVGEGSRIPHVGGIRKDLIDHLRKINASVIRWPGGIFASGYDWKDGIGPRQSRPIRTSFWNRNFKPEVPIGPQRYDPNQFGTDEFMQLCKVTGARPFLTANIRGLAAQEFDRWVEYCNAPKGSTSLAEQRAKNGSPDPYRVRYWGVGNEAWGVDGAQTIEEYLDLYKRFASMAPPYGDEPILIASGAPHGLDLDWVRKLIEGVNAPVVPPPLSAVSVHYYAGLPANERQPNETFRAMEAQGRLQGLPPAISPDEASYYQMLAHYSGIEPYLESHWKVMKDVDPQRKIKLAVDEWGAICEKGTEISAVNYWSRAVTLRDVLGAALTLDTLNRHADKVMVACFTGLINQEGGLFIAEGDKFVPSGIYHVFEMYAAHQGGRWVRTEFDAPSISFGQGDRGTVSGLNGSASLKDNILTLTVVNPHARHDRETEINLQGGRIKQVRHATITHEDIQAQNTFEDPNRLRAVDRPISGHGPSLICHFPPASVNKLTIELG